MSNNFKGVTCIRILTKNPPSPLQGSGRSGPPLRVQSGPSSPCWGWAGATPQGAKAENKRTVTGGHSKPIKDYVLPYGALVGELL